MKKNKYYKVVKFSNGTYGIKCKSSNNYVGIDDAPKYNYTWSINSPNYIIKYCQTSYQEAIEHFHALNKKKYVDISKVFQMKLAITEVNFNNQLNFSWKEKRHLKKIKHYTEVASTQEIRYNLCKAEETIIRLKNEIKILKKNRK